MLIYSRVKLRVTPDFVFLRTHMRGVVTAYFPSLPQPSSL